MLGNIQRQVHPTSLSTDLHLEGVQRCKEVTSEDLLVRVPVNQQKPMVCAEK